MAKIVKCKTCGAEIAKTAKRCPHCGAKQHVVASSICSVIVVLVIIAIFSIVKNSLSDVSSHFEDTQQIAQENSQTISFFGNNYSAEYSKCWIAEGVTGCFYVDIKINNTGTEEYTYMLDDVYVNNTHCQSGTGVPVTALQGKTVNGSFIVFCETPLPEVSKLEFRLSVFTADTFDQIETSDTITVDFS